jgi:tetratricopeptide (TPR) repeat protein
MQEDHAGARSRYKEALEITRELGDKRSTAGSLVNLALACRSLGDRDAARAALEEALEIFKEFGSERGIATCNAELAKLDDDAPPAP